MKQLGIIMALGTAMLLAGCGGSNSNSDTVSGHWTANLTDLSGNPVFSFTTDLNQNSGGSTITGTNLNFTTATPCFGSDSTETGGFSFSGNFNGNASGAFTLTIQSGTVNSNGNNTLNLQGTLNNNTVNGTWVLSGNGAGCTGSGNFTMNRG